MSCVPGIALVCTCADGVTQGVQVCDVGGRMLGGCDCGTGSAGIGNAGAGTAGVAGTGVPVGGASGVGASGVGASGVGGMVPSGGAPAGGMTGGSAAGTTGGAGTGAPAGALASDVRIKEIALYQAVKVPLSASGEPVIARNAPVIIGKEGLLRVFVEPLSGFSSRMIEVELTLESAEGPAAPQTAMKMVSSASSDAELESTINFDIPGDQVTSDLKYSVALRDPAQGSGTVDPAARFPMAEGELIEMGARDAGPLRVMLIPYRYQGDGSGRLPAMENAQLELFQRYMHSFYPASQIEITMHEPVDYDAQVGPNTGWEQWLDFHCNLRTEEDPDPKLLYYGLMSPRDSLNAYGGGIAGISPVPSASSNYGRCSVGLGFEGNVASSTMAHELGHSLGLPHAPCGVDGGPFPYDDAFIGSWGYSLGAKELRDPTEYHDMMSYCDPAFISDYNFEKLFERIRYLNLQFDVLPASPVRYTRVLLDKTGVLSVRGQVTTKYVPGGDDDARVVTLRDAKGRALSSGKAFWLPFSEGGTGLWLVPQAANGTARSVRLGNTTVVLP